MKILKLSPENDQLLAQLIDIALKNQEAEPLKAFNISNKLIASLSEEDVCPEVCEPCVHDGAIC